METTVCGEWLTRLQTRGIRIWRTSSRRSIRDANLRDKFAIAIILVDVKDKWWLSLSSGCFLGLLTGSLTVFPRSVNVVFRTYTAEVVCPGSHLTHAQHTRVNGCGTSVLTI